MGWMEPSHLPTWFGKNRKPSLSTDGVGCFCLPEHARLRFLASSRLTISVEPGTYKAEMRSKNYQEWDRFLPKRNRLRIHLPLLERYRQLLLSIEKPVTDQEAAILAYVFGVDDRFGLAWGRWHI
jgi:hypothetical protein